MAFEFKPKDVVKRHYYIYGTEVKDFLPTDQKVCFISKNASPVWRRDRVLLFDGATRENRLSLENLESMCLHKCAIQRERIYRNGIRLQRDFQLVICSEVSPFELYATWDRTWERELMEPECYRIFQTYFTIFGGDNNIEQDRAEFLTPSLLLDYSYDEAWASIVHQVKRSMRRLPPENGYNLTNRSSSDPNWHIVFCQ